MSEALTILGAEAAALPTRPCPGCGEAMTSGVSFGGFVVYAHLKGCSVLAEREAAEDRARRLRLRSQLLEDKANLPLDDDGKRCADLADYVRRFPTAESTREGIHVCRKWHHQAKDALPRDGFGLFGAIGTGKSTLAAALGRSLISDGINVRCEPCPQLYNRLFRAFGEGGLDEELSRLARVPVLILDDLGREKPSPFWIDQMLFPLIDERYVLRRPVIVTTNFSYPDLAARWGRARNERGDTALSHEAIIDRLQARCRLIPFGGTESNRLAAAIGGSR